MPGKYWEYIHFRKDKHALNKDKGLDLLFETHISNIWSEVTSCATYIQKLPMNLYSKVTSSSASICRICFLQS